MNYNVHCTHARMNVHLGFKKKCHRGSKNILNSTWLSHHLHCRLPPREDEPGILICPCVTCRKTLDLKK